MDQQIPDSQALPAGTRLEEFMIESVLGSGGFGITYLAKDTSLGRQVVIKENLPSQFVWRETTTGTVRPRHSTGGDADDFEWSMRNFLREAETLASMDHAGIVRVLRKFEANGTAYFVMPFVEGVEFGSLIARRAEKGQPFTEDELRGLTERMLDALGYLHDRGIYHRDIKPGNILITNEGVPTLIDFGSARQRLSERSMTVVESAGYTPFEQLQSRGQVGPWSDLYALAATIAKAITFETPPKAADRMMGDPWTGLAGDPNYAAAYSQRFLLALDRAMAVDPQGRWQNAGEWLTELRSEHSRQPAAAMSASLPTAPDPTSTAPSFQGAAAQPTPLPPPALPPSRAHVAWLTGLAAGCIAMVRSPDAWVCSTATAPSLQGAAAQPTPLPPPSSPPSRAHLAWLTGLAAGCIAMVRSSGAWVWLTKKMSRVGWTISACLLLGLVVWGLVRPNRPGEEREFEIAPGVMMRMCWIPPGEFVMGSPANEPERDDDETQDRVTLTQGFWLGKYEVTQAQWEAVTGSNPSKFKGADLPVDSVSWDDVAGPGGFLEKANQHGSRTGQFHLPTEAQWEYACRAGTTTALNSGKNLTTTTGACPNLDEVAWYGENSGKKPHPGGQKKANAWGLHDMHGNVWEWCADRYDCYVGKARTFRGGGWGNYTGHCRAAQYCPGNFSSHTDNDLGFRVVLAPGQAEP